VHEKKPPRIQLNARPSEVLVHTGMGAVMGLVMGALLLALYPTFAVQLEHQGILTVLLFRGALATAFAIGATLTGIALMNEDARAK
jgi:uncharacterized membrane protein